MARVNLRCTCGFFFTVHDSQIAQGVTCPSCRKPVGTDGPVMAPARPAAASPAGQEGKSYVQLTGKTIGLVAGGAAALIIVIIVIVVAMSGGGKEPVAETERERRPSSKTEISSSRKSDSERPPSTSSTNSPAPAKAVVPPAAVPKTSSPPAVPAATPKPVEPTPPPPVGAGLPPDLLAMSRELFDLPVFYRDLCLAPQDRVKAEPLVSSGRGSPEEAQFLRDLILSPKVKAVQAEAAYIKDSLAQLEREALESLPVDRVAMLDGRIMNGRILEEGPEMIRLERKLAGGASGMMNLKRAEVKEVQKGKGIGKEFQAKWETAAKGSTADRLALLGWCRDNSLPSQSRLVAFRILKDDPGNPPARTELELPADLVKAALDAAAQGGAIVYQGRNWVPKELKEKLLKDGFVLANGAWFTKRDRIITVPGLFRYEKQSEKPVLFSSTVPLNHETESIYRSVPDAIPQRMKEVAELKYLRRFYAPTLAVATVKDTTRSNTTQVKDVEVLVDAPEPLPGKILTGEVGISVPIGQPIIEAWVTTLAETKQDGTINVFLVVNGERTKLYQCTAREDTSHKLPDSIRGQTSVDLIAVISMPAVYTSKIEKRSVCNLKMTSKEKTVLQRECEVVHERKIPEYRAMLFPSSTTTGRVFELKAVVGEPAPVLNRLFADVNASELLK